MWLPLVGILLISAVLYAPSLKFPFINFDDDVYVYNNPLIRDLNPEAIREIFISRHTWLFSPLVIFSYALEYQLWGNNPTGFRAVNLLLHGINIILIYLLLFRIFGSILRSALVSLIFAVHPLRIESVVWITERKDVLFTFLLLLALHFYLSYLRSGNRRGYLASLLFTSLAMLAKVSAFIALPLLFLLDWVERKPVTLTGLFRKAPFFLVILLLTLTGMGVLNRGNEAVSLGLVNTLVSGVWLVSFMVLRFFWPLDLAIRYPEMMTDILPDIWICLLLILIFFFMSGFLSRWNHVWRWGAAWFLIGLLPAVGVMWRGYPIADRYSYLPSVGLALIFIEMVYAIWYRIKGRYGRYLLVGLPLAAFSTFIVYAFITYLPIWSDSLSIWNNVIHRYPRAVIAYGNRAVCWLGRAEYDKALADYNIAIHFKPTLVTARWNRALLLEKKGDIKGADSDFLKVLVLDASSYFPKLVNLADQGLLEGRYERALGYGEVLGQYRQDDFYHYMMAILHTRLERWAEAVHHIEAALQIHPDVSVYLQMRTFLQERVEKNRGVEQKVAPILQ